MTEAEAEKFKKKAAEAGCRSISEYIRMSGEQDQYYVTDTHPAIISREDFHKVQELLDKQRKKYNVVFNTEYPLNCIYTTLLFATIIAGVALFIFSKKKTYSSISVKTNISQKSTSKIDYKIIRHIASQKNSHLF